MLTIFMFHSGYTAKWWFVIILYYSLCNWEANFKILTVICGSDSLFYSLLIFIYYIFFETYVTVSM